MELIPRVHRATPFNIAHVEVPETATPLGRVESDLLRSNIDPLGYSDSHGLDLYLRAREFVQKDT